RPFSVFVLVVVTVFGYLVGFHLFVDTEPVRRAWGFRHSTVVDPHATVWTLFTFCLGRHVEYRVTVKGLALVVHDAQDFGWAIPIEPTLGLATWSVRHCVFLTGLVVVCLIPKYYQPKQNLATCFRPEINYILRV